MAGVQCKKRLYLNKHGEKLGISKDEDSEQQKAIFAAGTSVGELAQQLFPDGIDCTPEVYSNLHPSIEQTSKLVSENFPVIYEAAFQFDQVFVALDILIQKADGWHAYEVKSTNDTKDTHIQDAALQYWVITNSGVKLKSMNVLHLNRNYIRVGDLNIHELFTWDDITEDVILLQPKIAIQIKANKDCLEEPNIPSIEIGPHCSDPYPCNFMGTCWKHIPDYSVFNLTRARNKSWNLYEQGILNIEDIPDGFRLSGSQQLQVSVEKSGETFIDRTGIQTFLKELNYPLYYLDFERVNPAVPARDYTRPYQGSVFQYSLHIQNEEGGPVIHKELLADPKDKNFRTTIAEQLISDMGRTGDVIVYNKAFEATRLKELIRDFPQYMVALEGIRSRMVDLAVPFQQKLYYSPEMRGSYSIKKVLPALIPDKAYSELEIQDGGAASLAFLQMVQGQFEGDENQTRTALLKYCERDTEAMLWILEKLTLICST